MRQAEVYTNKCMAGILTETDDGKYIFRYNDSYLLDKNRQPYHYHFLKVNRNLLPILFFPSFYNMLSEGANKTIQCQTLKIDEDDVFGLLLATAHSDTIGAITVKKI